VLVGEAVERQAKARVDEIDGDNDRVEAEQGKNEVWNALGLHTEKIGASRPRLDAGRASVRLPDRRTA
jgi:hypothetical protein